METLSAALDFDTMQALLNLKRFLEALEQSQTQLAATGNSAEQLEHELAAVGATSTTAATKIKAASTSSAQAAQDETKHRQTGVDAAHKYLDTIDKEDKAKSKMVDTNRRVQQSVLSFIGAYAGFNGALQVLEQIKERTNKIIDSQAQLTGTKWELDKASATVAENMGLSGKQGQDTARKLTGDVAKATGMNFDQTANLIGSAQSFGFDARQTEGRQVVEKLGAFAARTGLEGKDELDGLLNILKAAQGQGRNLDQVLAGFDVLGMNTGKSNPRAVMSAAVAAVIPSMAQGISFEEAMAQYSALATTAPTAREGAEQSRMLTTMAQFATPEQKTKVASFAAKTGRLKGYTPTSDAEFEASVAAGGGEDQQAIRRMRTNIGLVDREGQLDDEGFERDISEERVRGKLSADEEDLKRRKHAVDVEQRNQRIADLKIDLKQREDKARGKLDSARQTKLLDAMSTSEKISLAKGMVIGATTEDEEAEIANLFGTQPERMRALRNASGESAMVDQAKMVQMMRSPEAVANTAAKNAAYRETSPAQQNLAEVTSATADAAAVDPGMEFATRFETAAKDTATRMMAGETSTIGSMFGATTTQFTSAGYTSNVMADELLKDMGLFLSTMTPQEKTSNAGLQLLSIYKQAHADLTGNLLLAPSVQRAKVMNFARAYGNARSQIEGMRSAMAKARGGQVAVGAGIVQPLMAPATDSPGAATPGSDDGSASPGTTSPVAGGSFGGAESPVPAGLAAPSQSTAAAKPAAPSSVVNLQIGNYFPGGGDMFPATAGRLEADH